MDQTHLKIAVIGSYAEFRPIPENAGLSEDELR